MPCPSTIPFRPLARRTKASGRVVPRLKRRRPCLEPRRRFVLFCEGKNTEPAYFAALKNACSSTLIAVEVVPGVGVPYTIAEKALAHVTAPGHGRGRRNSFEKRDQVWAVFDRDDHPRFDEAIALCERHGIRVGRSNPCFELWLIPAPTEPRPARRPKGNAAYPQFPATGIRSRQRENSGLRSTRRTRR